MKRQLLTICFTVLCSVLTAQDYMRIHYKNGGHIDVPITEIDSLSFIKDADDDNPKDNVSLTGSWLWGNQEAGYYELLTFNDDHTYIGYDNYFTYGFDTTTYGRFMLNGVMLTLQSNGFGYQRRYNWFVTALTENALEVMTKMGTYIYYRLQPEIIHLQVGNSLACGDEDSVVFADGFILKYEQNKLIAMASGTTHVLMKDSHSNDVFAYKVIID